MLWPDHSRTGKESVDLMPPLQKYDFDLTINKGGNPAVEAYSGFDGTTLDETLQEKKKKNMVVIGCATDYCS